MTLSPQKIYPMLEISPAFLSATVQLLVSAGFAALVVQLLLVRQTRRKIDGEATENEANAASTLSGAALNMVERSQQEASSAKEEAVASREEQNRLWGLLNVERWERNQDRIRIQILESALRQAQIEIPPLIEVEPPPEIKQIEHKDV